MGASGYGQLQRDIEIGYIEGEHPVKEFLLNKFGVRVKNVGTKHKDWDLEFDSFEPSILKTVGGSKKRKALENKFIKKFGRTFEIKRDKMSDKTGNFFVEVWSSFKVKSPGCLFKSKADVLVIVRQDEFIFVNMGLFMSWLLSNFYCDTDMSQGWREKTQKTSKKRGKMMNSFVSPNVRGILVPIEDIKKDICIEVFER